MEKQDVYAAISQLIADAKVNEDIRRVLQYGTPHQKLELLSQEPYNLTFERLVDAHKDLESIIFEGSVRWWWW